MQMPYFNAKRSRSLLSRLADTPKHHFLIGAAIIVLLILASTSAFTLETKGADPTIVPTKLLYYNSGGNGSYDAQGFRFLPDVTAGEIIQDTYVYQKNTCSGTNLIKVVVTDKKVYAMDHAMSGNPPTSWNKQNTYPLGVTKFIGGGGTFGYDALLGDDGNLYGTSASSDRVTLQKLTTNTASSFLPAGITMSNVTNFFVATQWYDTCTSNYPVYVLVYKSPSQTDRYKFLPLARSGSMLVNYSSSWQPPDLVTPQTLVDAGGVNGEYTVKLSGSPTFMQANTINAGSTTWKSLFDYNVMYSSDFIANSLWDHRARDGGMEYLLQDDSNNIQLRRSYPASNQHDVIMGVNTCKGSVGYAGVSNDSLLKYEMILAVDTTCDDPANPPTGGDTGGGTVTEIVNNYVYKGVSIHAQIDNVARLELAGTATARSGDRMRFTLTVNNPDAAKSVDVKFDLPPGFTYQQMGVGSSPKTSLSPTAPNAAAGQTGTLYWPQYNAPTGDSTLVFTALVP